MRIIQVTATKEAREKTLGMMRKLKADATRNIDNRKAAAAAAEARAAELAAEGDVLRARIQVHNFCVLLQHKAEGQHRLQLLLCQHH